MGIELCPGVRPHDGAAMLAHMASHLFVPDPSSGRSRIPARYRTLLWIAALFIIVNTLVRIGLVVFEHDPANYAPVRLLGILAAGLVYDLAAATYVLVPFILLATFFSDSRLGRFAHGVVACALIVAGLFGMLFTAVSEGLFWNEFASRFNFIAVDYLIYTREVIGNIRESYPIGWILTGIAVCALVLFVLVARPVWRSASGAGGRWLRRYAMLPVLLALPAASFFFVGDGVRELLSTASARELAGNGYYDFMRAFRSNNLDFQTFYKTVPVEEASQVLRNEFLEAQTKARFVDNPQSIERRVEPGVPARPMNVVLVSMESLGADFVESFGGRKGLTPNLDRLAHDGLMFTQLYATGLRTVRGLEAITLSIPPTPGHAVPMRNQNKGFQTLGGVLAGAGYDALYLYGGYSYFDNMRDFFSGNGYTVVDRTAIPKEKISHENIWGVADEDLFGQALTEIDARVAAGHKVFMHVMTTSNHRPFTFPDGRIDLPQGARDSAVKYADWSIGKFMQEAQTRPWFKNTLFVFLADHTSNGRGRTDLPPENYRIPLIIYAPGTIAPAQIDYVASQIDVAPTVLGLLDLGYTSRFFGQDILTEGRGHQRAFMANYLTVGYMEGGMVVELSPRRRVRVVDAATGKDVPLSNERAAHYAIEAISYYERASDILKTPAPPIVLGHAPEAATAPH